MSEEEAFNWIAAACAESPDRTLAQAFDVLSTKLARYEITLSYIASTHTDYAADLAAACRPIVLAAHQALKAPTP